MSYILDALRKSEQERKREESPLLHPPPPPRKTVPQRAGTLSTAARSGILLLAVVLLGGVLFYGRLWPEGLRLPFGHGKQSPSPPSARQAATSSQSDERMRHEEALISAGAEAYPPEKTLSGKNPPLARTIVREPAPLVLAQEKSDVPAVINRKSPDTPTAAQLPPAAQADVGKMRFAGHVFSDEAPRRMIMINNKILREGDTIDTDFRLQEITRSGVILLYKSTPFRIDLF